VPVERKVVTAKEQKKKERGILGSFHQNGAGSQETPHTTRLYKISLDLSIGIIDNTHTHTHTHIIESPV